MASPGHAASNRASLRNRGAGLREKDPEQGHRALAQYHRLSAAKQDLGVHIEPERTEFVSPRHGSGRSPFGNILQLFRGNFTTCPGQAGQHRRAFPAR